MWATRAIDSLRARRETSVCPRGRSMEPRVRSGEIVHLRPVTSPLKKGDVVLAKVNGRIYLHLVSAVEGQRVQISNNRGRVNGWASEIYGVAERHPPL